MKRKPLPNLSRLGWLLASLQLPYAQTSSVSGVIKDTGMDAILSEATLVAASWSGVNIVSGEDTATPKLSKNYSDCLNGWTPRHPEGSYYLMETKL